MFVFPYNPHMYNWTKKYLVTLFKSQVKRDSFQNGKLASYTLGEGQMNASSPSSMTCFSIWERECSEKESEVMKHHGRVHVHGLILYQ